MDRVKLFEEFRMIERNENEVNVVWKGAHLLLFVLAFIFGSLCTFCFHMLMYMFDEKCVLFPKFTLTSLRHNVIYEFVPEDFDRTDSLPVDFLSTQWIDKSACYLPTYVPLVSGIFGLVWITMFVMCSTGSQSLTGLQRPWRVVPPVFIFSLVMSGLCIYSSTITHNGLEELCIKLGEITGSSTCSYAINVATLAYERRIRGVFQATRLTIICAWLHTCCWLLSALLALVRILLAVDFQLVRVKAELLGNMDKLLESREEHIRTVSPEHEVDIENTLNSSLASSQSSTEVYHQNKNFTRFREPKVAELTDVRDILYFADEYSPNTSELSLVPEERNKLKRLEAYKSVPKDLQFIVKTLYDLLDGLELPESPLESPTISLSTSSILLVDDALAIGRQYGQDNILYSKTSEDDTLQLESVQSQNTGHEKEVKNTQQHLKETKVKELVELTFDDSDDMIPSTSKKKEHIAFESSLNLTSEMKRVLDKNLNKHTKKKSTLKNIGTQAEQQKDGDRLKQKVTMSESKSANIRLDPSPSKSHEDNAEDDKDKNDKHKDFMDKDKETQTRKEKQD